jgi:hypothetical protein
MDLSGRPLTDNSLDRSLFVDRADEVRRLLASVERRSNALVTGAPGIGKTSLLHRAARELRSRGYEPTFIDAAPASSVEDLIELIRWRLGNAPVVSPANPSLTPGAGQERLGGAAAVTRLLATLGERVAPDERRVLLIDEPPSGEIGHALFGRLRDEVWQLPFTWVVAIDDHQRVALARPPADAFFPVIVELGPLEPGDALELLENRLDATPAPGLDRLVEIGRGSPRRLLALARELVIDERSADEILRRDQQRSAVLDELGESAGLLFSFLQEHGASSASDHDLLTATGWTRARATQVLNSLEDAGLAVGRREKGGRRKLYELTTMPE